jgi:hypothetical protein
MTVDLSTVELPPFEVTIEKKTLENVWITIVSAAIVIIIVAKFVKHIKA